MHILAVETATPLCGVAVLAEGDAPCASDLGERVAVRRQAVTTHSEMLLPLIAECLAELSLRAADLSGVVCGAGPGSFTGLRIGVATAKGLCFALGLPLTMVSSLHALAARVLHTQPGAPPVLAVLDAFRGQVFARLEVAAGGRTAAVNAVLESHPKLAEDAVWRPQELAEAVAELAENLILCGGGVLRYRDLWQNMLRGVKLWDEDPAPHPLEVARLGAEQLRAGQAVALHGAVPNYLCASAAEEASGAMAAGGG